MAIDWERVIVESDDNGVVVSAGQVSLLIGADADSVSWGNITGDITQQPDLMQIVDGYVSADSPTFTGTPRSVTPPEGNNSTRIATTAFVQGEMANVRRDVSDKVNEAPVNNHIWGRKDENWAQLGEMATVNEPARGISSSVPQRFVRTKEPDGDMVWEEVGTMAMLDAPDSLTPNITYGLYNGEMVNIDPTPNGSATKKYWLRTNELVRDGEHQGERDPKWEQAGKLALKDQIQAGDIEKPTDIYVDARNGNDDTGTGRFDAPFQTIGKAIQEASDIYQTTIMIQAGEYGENVIITDKKICLYSYSSSEEKEDVKINRLTVTRGTVFLNDSTYQDYAPVLHISDKLEALEGSKVICIDSIRAGRIIAKDGSFITTDEDFYSTRNVDTYITATNGSVVKTSAIISFVSRTSAGNWTANRIADVNNALVLYDKRSVGMVVRNPDSVIENGFSGSFITEPPENNTPGTYKYYIRKSGCTSTERGDIPFYNWEEFENLEYPHSLYPINQAEMFVMACYKDSAGNYQHKWVSLGLKQELENLGLTISGL